MKIEVLSYGLYLAFAAAVTLLFFLQRMRPPLWVKTLAKVTHVTSDEDGCIILHLDFEIASDEDPSRVQLYHAQEFAHESIGEKFGNEEKRMAKFSELDVVDLWYARHDPTEIHLKRPDNFVRFCGALVGVVVMTVVLYSFSRMFSRALL